MMIKTRGLTKYYGSMMAVDHIDLNIEPGEIYGFLGPNGAGKTSTIMMLLGLSKPTSGEIYLFGKKYPYGSLEQRKRIGVVPEKHPQGMWRWMTGWDYLKLFANLFDVKNSGVRIEYLMEKVDLLKVRNKSISKYSRGMIQKLSFIRALLHDPDILFLDEPISGLDPIGIKQIRDLIITESREGRTIFTSSHLLSEMEKICHRMAIIHNGRLLVENTMGNLLSGLSGEREIIVELDEIPSDIENLINKLQFVINVAVIGNILKIRVQKKGDFRKELSTFLYSRNCIPLNIHEKQISLEEAFITITRDNIESLTQTGVLNES